MSAEMTKLKVHQAAPGLEPLLSEQQTIQMLGLQDRPKPLASLAWLRRTRQLGYVRLGRGIYAYPRGEIERFLKQRYQAPCAATP